MKQKLLSIVLVLSLCLGLMPATALAAEEPTYELYVGGVQVTDSNLSGEGWTYDPDTNTLTLNGYTYEGAGYSWEDDDGKYAAAIYYGGSDTLNIVLEGMNSVTQKSDTTLNGSYGIFSDGSLEIDGTGSLTAISGAATGEYGESFGVYAYNDISVTGGSLTGTGGAVTGEYGESCGVYAYNDISVTGGSLTGTSRTGSYSYGVDANDITVTGGSLEGSGGAATGEYGESFGVIAYNDITVTGGSLEGTSSVGNYSSCGVCANYNISVTGTGSLKGTGGDNPGVVSAGVYAHRGDISVSESGKLMGTGGTADAESGYSMGVYAYVDDYEGSIAVTGGSLTGIGGEAGESYGVSSYGNIDLTGGEVIAQGHTQAFDTEPNVATGLAAYDVNDKEIKNPDYTALTYVKIYVSEESDFTDVKKGSYYYDAVNWAVAKGITSGTTATTFSPNNPCTRAQMATFLWRTAGSPDPIGSVSPFTDVPADTYYATAVQWAYEQGITGGTSTTTFSPDAPCTRAQMATFLWRYAGSPEVDHDLSHFVDANQISSYAREALEWANLNGIINGKANGILDPKGNATRAQVAQMLMNYLVNVL